MAKASRRAADHPAWASHTLSTIQLAGLAQHPRGRPVMSISSAMANVQASKECALRESTSSELTSPKFTAALIEKDCPARLHDLAKEITEGLEKVYQQEKLADDQVIAVKKLIAEVKALCDVGGFTAFREKFF